MTGKSERARTYLIDGHTVPAPALAPGLYLVATPIGNLGDVTLRALATLAAADVVACEDTRVTAVLTRRFGIEARLMAYHDHNAAKQRPKLLAVLGEGKSVALVSDAGTPLVSDPGFDLANEARAAGHAVLAVPGASALLAALVISGLPTDAFLFAGFLPPKQTARRKRLEALAHTPATLIFFKSPQRVAEALTDMATSLGGERHAVVARELTKVFEQTRRNTLRILAEEYADEPPPKGEVVVVVGPPLEAAVSAEDVDHVLTDLLGEKSLADAASEAAKLTGLSRRVLYQRALDLKGRK